MILTDYQNTGLQFGTKISMCSLSISVGIGSSAHDLEVNDVTSL